MTTPAVIIEPSRRYVAVPAWGARSSNRTPKALREALKYLLYGAAPEELQELTKLAKPAGVKLEAGNV